MMSDYNVDLGQWGVSSIPALMAKIVGPTPLSPKYYTAAAAGFHD